MAEAPPFWYKPRSIIPWLLAPFSAIWGRVAARRMLAAPKGHADVPVLCVGNLVAGGAGKTPTAVAIAAIAREMGLRPGFLSRGYGGSVTVPTIVDGEAHNAHDVGDEPLLLAQHAVTVVSADRPAGAQLLTGEDVDLIIMDDGFQNPSLHKDYSLVVIDAHRGIGNGFCHPAGPVRAKLDVQIAQASAILLIGQSAAGTKLVRMAARAAKPVLNGEIKVRQTRGWDGRRVLAFAAIANPAKFFDTLKAIGSDIVDRKSFEDHHQLTNEECEDLLDRAEEEKLIIVTTEKDMMRLQRMGAGPERLHANSRALLVDLVFENPKMVRQLLRKTISNWENSRLARKKLEIA